MRFKIFKSFSYIFLHSTACVYMSCLVSSAWNCKGLTTSQCLICGAVIMYTFLTAADLKEYKEGKWSYLKSVTHMGPTPTCPHHLPAEDGASKRPAEMLGFYSV